jgi:nucleoid-associated protein YgaU
MNINISTSTVVEHGFEQETDISTETLSVVELSTITEQLPSDYELFLASFNVQDTTGSFTNELSSETVVLSTETVKSKPEFRLNTKHVYHENTVKKHVVITGETLPDLAEKYYKNKDLWYRIYEVNKDNIQKGIIKPGQTLVIP